MNWSLLLFNLLPAVIIGVVTLIYQARPPKSPNMVYGYRTARSMASQEAWDYANKRSIFWLWMITLLLLVSGVILTFTTPAEIAQPALYIGMCVLLVMSLPVIERELKKRFGDEA